EAVNSLMRYDNFVLTTHLNPDGDALGSLLGLGLALLNTGKNVVMIMPHPVPGTFQFLPGVQQVQQTVDCLERFDVGIALDCADFNRIGEETRDQLRKTKTLINIDHHVSNQHFGDINIVDPQAAATGEIICDILLETKIP